MIAAILGIVLFISIGYKALPNPLIKVPSRAARKQAFASALQVMRENLASQKFCFDVIMTS